jgi:hypothetical protein
MHTTFVRCSRSVSRVLHEAKHFGQVWQMHPPFLLLLSSLLLCGGEATITLLLLFVCRLLFAAVVARRIFINSHSVSVHAAGQRGGVGHSRAVTVICKYMHTLALVRPPCARGSIVDGWTLLPWCKLATQIVLFVPARSFSLTVGLGRWMCR